MLNLESDEGSRLLKVFDECFDFANLGIFELEINGKNSIILKEKYRELPNKEYKEINNNTPCIS